MLETRDKIAGSATGLYIHVPFCKLKCPYCDFNSIVSARIPEKRYVDCLIRELDNCLKGSEFDRPLDTLYIGGGTPSILPLRSIERLLSHIRASFQWTQGIEVTIEANPTSIDRAKLDGYLKAGINRISLGVQSLSDGELKALGRTHSAKEAIRAFRTAREAGFTSIGVDLIYAIPGQSVSAFKENLERAVKLAPEHLSVYCLTLEEGVEMQRAVNKGEVTLVSDEVEAACFELAIEVLGSAGYTHYEISNFALAGHESRHNKRYWESRDYLGLGAGAHSCSSALAGSPEDEPGTRRWWNIKDVEGYMHSVEERGSARAGGERLSREQESLEALYLGLRLLEGIDIDSFKEKFKILPMELLDKKAVAERLVEIDTGSGQGARLKLTPRGLLFSNELF